MSMVFSSFLVICSVPDRIASTAAPRITRLVAAEAR
jgi:hypothetical protein